MNREIPKQEQLIAALNQEACVVSVVEELDRFDVRDQFDLSPVTIFVAPQIALDTIGSLNEFGKGLLNGNPLINTNFDEAFSIEGKLIPASRSAFEKVSGQDEEPKKFKTFRIEILPSASVAAQRAETLSNRVEEERVLREEQLRLRDIREELKKSKKA